MGEERDRQHSHIVDVLRSLTCEGTIFTLMLTSIGNILVMCQGSKRKSWGLAPPSSLVTR